MSSWKKLCALIDIAARSALKAPIHLYRLTLRPWLGWPCRHMPTCSEYALEAIDKNGAWKGLWLILSRLLRCHPWGTAGIDPVPDLTSTSHPWQPWQYGRWSGKHIIIKWEQSQDSKD
ncbi:MAG: membrane protein insertion efficiency factor YidD [Pseudomonadota bacterium]